MRFSPGAHVWHDGNGIHLILPTHIANGSTYTPPSVELRLRVNGPPRGNIQIKFVHYAVTVNVVVLGDVHATCAPAGGPHPIGTIQVTRSASAN